MQIYKMIQKLVRSGCIYGRMIKFSHTVFALPFAMSAALLAYKTHPFGIREISLILLAMVGARSAAMGVNRLVDARIDQKNPRTANREIPSGKLSRRSALIFISISSFLYFTASYLLGELPFILSLPVLLLLFLYSWTKHFTWLCHLYLGFVISLSPAGTYIALTGTLIWPVVFLSAALMTYIAGFDILYACQDFEFDKKEGLFSVPVRYGVNKALTMSSLAHLASFLLFLCVYTKSDLGYVFLGTICLIGILYILEHQLINARDLKHINIAFFHVNSAVSMVLFCGIVLDLWLLGASG